MGEKEQYNDKKKKKNKVMLEQQSCFFDDLIIEEILTRLPVKSILRFKSVSKQWYSTLSSSNFSNAHLIKSPFSRPSAPVDTLFIKCGNTFYLSSCDDDQISGNNFQDNFVQLDVDFGIEEKLFQHTGSCHGLICLTLVHDDNFIIWNPAIRKVHKYEPDGYLKDINFADRAFVVRGFGYASSVDDYKYVRIVRMRSGNEKGHIVHIFALKEKKWRKIDFDYGHDKFILKGGVLQGNGKLYMPAFTGIDFGRLVIVSFDLGLETFEITKINIDCLDILGVMGGCLSIINGYTQDPFMHIHESPTTMKSICLPNELWLNISSEMIGFTKSGKFFVTTPVSDDIFWDWPSRALWLVDTGTNPMGCSLLMTADDIGLAIARYVPSLVSPFPN